MSKSAEGEPEERATILLVEDEALMALTGRLVLEKNGYEVRHAKTGEEAVAAVESGARIDLVLMDLNLGPGIDGTEAARRILARRDLPLVFHSAHTERDIVEKTEGISSYGYIVKNSGETVLIASIKMAFRLFASRRAEQEIKRALTHSHDLMRYIIEHSRSAIAVHDRELRYLYVSRRYLEDYGVREEEVIGRRHYEVFPDLPEKWREAHRRALAGEVLSAEDDPYERADGSVDWTRWECRPWREADGRIGGIVVYTEVTTGRRRAEAEAAAALRKLRFHVDNMPLAFIEFDEDLRIVEWSRNAERLFGWRPEEALGRRIADLRWVYEEDAAQVEAVSERLGGEPGESNVSVNRNYRKDGSVITCAWHNSAMTDASGRMTSVYSFVEDVSEQKTAERRIRALLAEKELVLREVHHRVKNHLGSIRSLLLMQAEHRAEAAAALKDSAGRVESMMLLYDRLYPSESFSSASARAYLPPLAASIVALFPASGRVRLSAEVEDLSLEVATLSSLGIILNELITNSMKYAFEGREAGQIRLSLRRAGGLLRFEYSDDGVGLPDSLSFEGGSGFGLRLIALLAEQLRAGLRVERGAGARIVLELPGGE